MVGLMQLLAGRIAATVPLLSLLLILLLLFGNCGFLAQNMFFVADIYDHISTILLQ